MVHPYLTLSLMIGLVTSNAIAFLLDMNQIGRTRLVQRHKANSENEESSFEERNEGKDWSDDNDNDEIAIKPYRNRSLAWTKRYRKLNPYEKCRQRVLQFGHRSKEDWDEAMESGQLGGYVPSHPDEM